MASNESIPRNEVIVNIATNANGTNYQALGSTQVCTTVRGFNTTGKTLEFRMPNNDPTGSATFHVPTGNPYVFYGLSTLADLSVRPSDLTTTQVVRFLQGTD